MTPGAAARTGRVPRRAVRRAVALLASLLVVAVLAPAALAAPAPVDGLATRPNVVVVMVDDMDSAALARLPAVRSLIGGAGVTFDESITSYPLCCPSRATYLTGRYAHNHRVLGNDPPDGGFLAFDGRETLPVWLRRAGYATGHVGKYLNGYGRTDQTTVPPGWEEWYGLVDPGSYRMWGYTLNENGVPRTYGSAPVEDPALYQTDVLARKAVDYVYRRAPGARPFFLSVATLAPHGEGSTHRMYLRQRDPRPAPRHRGLLDGVPLPIPPSFDEADLSDKPVEVRARAPIDATTRQQAEARLRGRLESLLAVDEAVAAIVDALRRTHELDRTLVVFTSDNGWMQGEHRIPSGKVVPYEESLRVPLLLRGPGLPAGTHVPGLAANVDLAPTILDVTGVRPGAVLDGRSLLPAARGGAADRAVVIENGPRVAGPWYVGVRTQRWKYVEHSTGERELYDLTADPYELLSRHADPRYAGVLRALAAGLAPLKTCGGAACQQWRSIPEPPPVRSTDRTPSRPLGEVLVPWWRRGNARPLM